MMAEKSKKKYLIVGLVIIIGATFGAYFLDKWNNDIMTQTNILLSNVPTNCYTYFPQPNDTNIETGQVIYYQSVVDGINKTGEKYIGPFLRSPAFTMWLFQHCPMYNGTQSIFKTKQYNDSSADHSRLIQPSQSLIDQVKYEQAMMHYNYKQNPDNFTRIEYIASNFHQTLQSTIDNLFLAGALNITDSKQCINPSWRANSDIRQCTMFNSTFVVNLHNQNLMAIVQKPIEGLNLR